LSCDIDRIGLEGVTKVAIYVEEFGSIHKKKGTYEKNVSQSLLINLLAFWESAPNVEFI
jgi:hypothetical protein